MRQYRHAQSKKYNFIRHMDIDAQRDIRVMYVQNVHRDILKYLIIGVYIVKMIFNFIYLEYVFHGFIQLYLLHHKYNLS